MTPASKTYWRECGTLLLFLPFNFNITLNMASLCSPAMAELMT